MTTTPRRRDEALAEPVGHIAALDQVVLGVDVMLGGVDGAADRVVRRRAVDEQLNGVAGRGLGAGQRRADPKDLALDGRGEAREGALPGQRREAPPIPMAAALGEREIGVPLPLDRETDAIAPEEEEEARADAREEDQRQDPGDGAARLLPAEKDEGDQAEGNALDDDAKDDR